MCPITKSAKKTLRQSKKKRMKNIRDMKKMRKLLKEVEYLVSQKKIGEAKEILPKVYKVLDKGAKTGLIKFNTAARRKSRITRLLSKTE